jgi:hypothetical protein
MVVLEQFVRGNAPCSGSIGACNEEVLTRSIRDHEAVRSMHGLVVFDRAVSEACLSDPGYVRTIPLPLSAAATRRRSSSPKPGRRSA